MSDLISRQAAIEVVDAVWSVTGDKNVAKVWDQIKDLPSAQPEHLVKESGNLVKGLVNDCISRKAALQAMDTWDKFGCDPDGKLVRYDDDKQPYVHYEDMVDAIKNLPSVQQERKTGRWVERNPQNSPVCRLIECSECGNGYIVGYNIDYDDWINGRDFCMRCGADLRGGNNG